MLKRTKIAALLASNAPQEQVLLKGWVRTRRDLFIGVPVTRLARVK